MPELSELSPELSKDSTASKKDRYIQREMTLRNNFTVTKRNVLNNFLPRDLSTQEIRLFNIYLSKINPLDIATRRVRFPLEDFHRIMGFESRVHITYLKGIIDDMLGKVTGLPLGRKEEERFPFFKKCQLDRDGFGEWYIEFDAHDDAVIWLFGFKKHFFKYELWNILRLKSRNQIWLFEALKSIQGFGYRVVSIETLKKVLGIPEEKYAKSFASFNRDVLKVCQSVLAKYTDITFTYEPYGRRGRGGKVFFLKIYVNENKAFIPPSAISRFVELRNPEEIAKNLSRNTFSEEIFDLHSASEEHEPIIKVLVKKQAHEETYHSMTRLEYMDFVTDKKFTESQLKQLDKAMKTQYPRIYNNVGLTVSKFENLFKIAHAAHLEGIIYTDIFRYLLGVIRLSAEEELVDEALDARKLREAKMRTEDRETDQDIGDAVIEGKYKIASSETYELLMSKKARAEGKKHIKEIPITESPEEMRAEIAKRDNAEQLAMKNRIIEQFISNNVKIMQLIEEKQGTRNRIKRKGIEESPKAEEPEKEEIKVKQQDNSQEDNKKTESAEKEQIMTEEAKIEPEENPISEEDRRWIRQAMERDRAKARAIIAKKEEEDRIRAEKELEYLDPDRPPVGRTEELVWYMMQKSKIKTRAAKKAEIGSETKNEGEISETQLSREKREEELLIQLEEKLMGRKLTEEEEDEDLEIFIPERYSDGSPVRPRGFERWVRDFHEAKLSGYLRWIIKGIDLKLSAEEKNLSKTNKGFYIFLRDFSRRYRLAPIAETESKDSENPDSELVEKSKFDAECLNSESFFERTGQTELLERVRSIRLGYRPGKMASDGDKWLHEAIIDKNGNPILYFFGFSIVSQEEIEEIEREIKKTWLSFDDSPPRERPPNAVITQEEFDEVQEIRKWHENPQGISPMERKRNEEKEEKLQDELLKSYGEPQEQVTRILSQEELDAYYEKENMRRDKEEAKRLQQEQEDNNYTDEYNNEYDRYDANGNYDPEFGEYNILGEHVGAKEYVYRYGDQFDFTDYEEARKDPEHMKKIEENYAKMLRDIEGFIKEEIAKKEKEHLLILLENPDDPDLPERLMRELMEFEDSLRNPPENFISPIEIQHQEQLARAEALKGLEHGIEVLLMFEKRSEVTQEEKIKILKKIIGESILTEPEKEELFQRATVGPWEKPSPPEPDEPEEEEEPIKIIYAEGERLRREKEGIKPPERWWNEKPSPMSAAAIYDAEFNDPERIKRFEESQKKFIAEATELLKIEEAEKAEKLKKAQENPPEPPSTPPESEEEEPIKIIYAEGERLRREKEGIKPPERWWNEKPSPMSAAAIYDAEFNDPERIKRFEESQKKFIAEATELLKIEEAEKAEKLKKAQENPPEPPPPESEEETKKKAEAVDETEKLRRETEATELLKIEEAEKAEKLKKAQENPPESEKKAESVDEEEKLRREDVMKDLKKSQQEAAAQRSGKFRSFDDPEEFAEFLKMHEADKVRWQREDAEKKERLRREKAEEKERLRREKENPPPPLTKEQEEEKKMRWARGEIKRFEKLLEGSYDTEDGKKLKKLYSDMLKLMKEEYPGWDDPKWDD